VTAAAAGAATVAYASGYELHAYRLRRLTVPVLAPGSRSLRVLHISDLHMTPGQNRKRAWVRSLAGLRPDLVVNTGDNLAHPAAVPVLMDALGDLLKRPGVFVLGSNDYYAPVFRIPTRYLVPGLKPPPLSVELPWKDLRDGLRGAGWADLGNAREVLDVDGRRVEMVGVDDPHIERDDYASVAGPAGKDADLTVGVAHAPYRRVLDAMAADGFALLMTGHTHGGQVCLPLYGTLVTNCDLDRRRARGLSHYAVGGGDGPDGSWLHVSAGLGTSPYAPFRVACKPEATLLTLVAGQ